MIPARSEVTVLCLRDLALQIGVSHAAPVHHFGDKAGLLTVIATDGFLMLAEELPRAYVATRGGRCVRALCGVPALRNPSISLREELEASIVGGSSAFAASCRSRMSQRSWNFGRSKDDC
jgi:AcrR family transcriptional regulator